MTETLFGTDGVRGVANSELTARMAFDLAIAAGESLDGFVLIGRDTRRSGQMLFAALQAGFNSVGVDVVDLGVIPVGAVSRLARHGDASLGVMVSASHNPAPDNGIKLIGGDGNKLTDEAEVKITAAYFSVRDGSNDVPVPTGSDVGSVSTDATAESRYLAIVKGANPPDLSGLGLVLDCANGAASHVAGTLFSSLGARVEVLNAWPTGMNINEACGATHPEALSPVVAGRVGICFDGDADRCIAVDETGAVVDGDVIMAILAKHMAEEGTLANNRIVATVMSNLGFKHAMRDLGIAVEQTQVGDRYVLEEMLRSGATLGGEQSGHIILEDRLSGDGLQTALRLATVLQQTGAPLTELRKVMQHFPQILNNVRVANKDLLDGAQAVWDAVGAAEAELGDEGRILVRASGTEPLVRVMVEAKTQEIADATAGSLSEIVASELA